MALTLLIKAVITKSQSDIVPEDLNLDACMEIIKLQSEKAASAPAKPKRGKYTKKKA